MTDEQAKLNIAANLLRLRGEKSYSQIARDCSTPEQTVYPGTIEKIEKCKHMPGVGLLSRIAAAIGTTVDGLLSAPTEKYRKKILEKIPA